MWVSRKEWQALKKRVADLEEQVQGQLDMKVDADAMRETLLNLERLHLSVELPPIRQF